MSSELSMISPINFWDKYGRLHTKPVTEANPLPTNNAYIYTAYDTVLNSKPFKLAHKDLVDLVGPMPFSRHPAGSGKSSPPISHDELTGVCILSSFLAVSIVSYLKANHNQFCDISGFKPTPFYKLNWFKIIPALFKVATADNSRHESQKYPELYPISFWQRPEYRWFYKRAAGLNPSLWERIMFLIARLFSIMNWKKEDPNLVLFFSMLHLRQSNYEMGLEGKLIHKLLNRKVSKNYRSIKDMMTYKTKDIAKEWQEFHPWFD